MNRLFVLLSENKANKIGHTGNYLPTMKVQHYNVMIDGRNFFDQSIRNNIKT